MNRMVVYLLLAALLVLGACTGTETAADAPVAEGAASPEVVVYLSPT